MLCESKVSTLDFAATRVHRCDVARTTLHKQIRKLRLEANLTQEDLAVKLGLDNTSVAHWEAGNRTPRGGLIPKLAKVLGVTVAVLYDEA